MITSKILNYHLGKAGNNGVNGIDGTDLTNVSLSKQDNPLFRCLNKSKLADVIKGQLTVSRTTDCSYIDDYNLVKWLLPETLTNYIMHSWDATDWLDPQVGNWSEFQSGQTDPDGGSLASTIQLNTDTTLVGDRVIGLEIDSITSGNITVQFWAQLAQGGDVIQSIDCALGDASTVTSDVKIITQDNLTTDWQFFSVTFSELAVLPTRLYINPRAAGGTFIEITFVSATNHNTVIPRIDTDGANQSTANTSNETRLTSKGLLLETSSTNQCLDSQNLNGSSWSVPSANADISQSSSVMPDGTKDAYTVVTNNAIGDVTLRNTNALLSDASAYNVSFWVQILSGTVDSVNVNVGGGTSADVQQPLAIMQRVDTDITSSSGGYTEITFVNPSGGFQAIVYGVQSELSGISSYIRTGAFEQTRAAEVTTLPYDLNMPDSSNAFTIKFRQFDIPDPITSINRTVFDNGQVGADIFKLYYSDSNDDLIFENGTISLTITDARLSNDIAITYDKTNLKGYVDGLEVSTTSAGTPSSFNGGTITLGENLNGSILSLESFDYSFNADEVLYSTGVVNDGS